MLPAVLLFIDQRQEWIAPRPRRPAFFLQARAAPRRQPGVAGLGRFGAVAAAFAVGLAWPSGAGLVCAPDAGHADRRLSPAVADNFVNVFASFIVIALTSCRSRRRNRFRLRLSRLREERRDRERSGHRSSRSHPKPIACASWRAH